MATGSENIRAIVEQIINHSAELIARDPGLDDKFYNLVNAASVFMVNYKDYMGLVEEYNLDVKRMSGLKSARKKLEKGQSIKRGEFAGMSMADISAQLDEVRLAQQQARANKEWTNKVETALRKVYDSVMKFQAEVNEFVNQSIEMVYVSTKSGKAEIFRLDHTLVNEMYSFTTDKNGRFILKYNTGAIESAIKQLQGQARANQMITTDLSGPLQTLLAEIINRYEAAEAKGSKVLLYKQGGKYYKASFTQFGDAMEAYVDAVVNARIESSETSIFSRPLDDQIAWFVNTYITKVDNASGFAQEDVQVNGGNLFYGVKSDSASLMGITYVAQFAELVLAAASGKSISRQQINKVINYFKGSTKARTAITEVAQAEYDAVVKEGTEELLTPLQNRH